MKITVIGGGSWGLGLSKVLDDNGHTVLVYNHTQDIVDAINHKHYSPHLDVAIPASIEATSNLKEAIKASRVIVFAVPTKVIREVITNALPYFNEKKTIVNAAKGIEPKTFLRVSEIFEEMVPKKHLDAFVTLSGPSHAEEVIRAQTTAVTAASNDFTAAVRVQKLFHNSMYFRVYSSDDVKGVELGGSLKNIFALASGIIRGIGLGDNALAAFMTRSMVEMEKIYHHLGADTRTLYGLSGVGDLIVTCTSKHSRNFQAGYKIGSGSDLEATLESMTMVVEGIRTTEAAHQLSEDAGLDTPIIDAIYNVVFNTMQPSAVISELLNRDFKAENTSKTV